MLRRHFLSKITSTAAAAGLAATSRSRGATTPRRVTSPITLKLERIAISTWSLHNFFRATRRSDFNQPGPTLALLDFPELIVEKYKVRHFEFCTTHFSSVDPTYLREIKYALMRTGSTIVNMPVDIKECGREGTFSSPNLDERAAALEAVKQWVDVAHALDVKSVRVGPGKVNPANLQYSVDSYKKISAYSQTKNVRVIVENHANFGTTNPEDMVRLFKLTGPGRIGALPDFANFPNEVTRERGLKLLFPYAQTVCHAKGLNFDATGEETSYDFPEALAIAPCAAFHGVYSIEFEGPGDPYTGIQRTLDELLKYL